MYKKEYEKSENHEKYFLILFDGTFRFCYQRPTPPPKSFQKVPKVLFSFCQKHPPPLWYFLGYVPVRKVPTPPCSMVNLAD